MTGAGQTFAVQTEDSCRNKDYCSIAASEMGKTSTRNSKKRFLFVVIRVIFRTIFNLPIWIILVHAGNPHGYLVDTQ